MLILFSFIKSGFFDMMFIVLVIKLCKIYYKGIVELKLILD